MKVYHFKIFTLSLISIFSLISCNDFLEEDPKGQLATINFFSNREDLDASLNALYALVATSQQSNGQHSVNMLLGDDLSTHPASNKQPLREFDAYGVSDNNSWMPLMWAQRYRVIKGANFIINNAGRTPDVSEEEIKSAIGQAHFWRAYEYFILVTTWGNVPVMLEEEIDYEKPLSSVEDIYKLIISDLEIAESSVPVQYSREPYFRNGVNIAVGQAAVKAAMSYVYMSMAGWPLNKGAAYYQLAADKAEEVINGVESGTYGYQLLDEYRKVYSQEYHAKNPELLLGVYFNIDRLPFACTPSDLLLDMMQGGWGDTNGEIKFWKDFPDGPRKEATYFPQIMLTDGNLYDWWYDTDPASRPVVAPVFMKSAEGPTRGQEFDYRNPAKIPAHGERTQQVIRLSEVYCWYAEAVGRSGQITAKAVDVLNKVRNRADGENSNIYSLSMTPNELAEAAYDEHGWEVAGYYWGGFATRYRDMFRMYRYKEHFEFRKENPMIEVAPGIFRNEAVPVTGTWDDSKMYAPYPYTEAVLNPNLK